MAKYINRENLNFLNDFRIDGGKYAGLRLDEVFDELATEDVIERSEHDRTVQAFKSLIEIKNVNLIVMQEKYYALEKEYAELKVNIDKAIEEIRQESIEANYYANKLLGSSHGMRKAIGILKRNIGE